MISLKAKKIIFSLLTIILVLIAFQRSIHSNFIDWDDDVLIYDNYAISSLNLKEIFTQTVNDIYAPLTVLSFAVEYSLFGLNPTIYHIDNILLHLFNMVLVWAFARKLGLSRLAAMIGMLIFGLHPMKVESVAWVTERKDVLYAFFYLISLIGYCYYITEGRLKYYWVSLIAALLSVLAKPMALSLPFIFLLMDWFYKRSYYIEYKDDKKYFLSGVVIEKLPFALIVFPIAGITYYLNARISHFNWHETPLIWIWTFVFYIKKFLFPFDLNPFYQMPTSVSLMNPEYLNALAIFIIVLGSLILLRKNKLIIFAFAFYFLSIFFLLRFDNLIDINFVADRFMYLPSLGFCLLFGILIGKLCESKFKVAYALIFVLVLSGMVYKTNLQTKVWVNPESFWNYVVEKDNTFARAYNHRGDIFYSKNMYEAAVQNYNTAIELGDRKTRIAGYRNLALFHIHRAKDFRLALDDVDFMLQNDKDNYWAISTKGYLLLELKEYELALENLNKAISMESNYRDYFNRGSVLLELKQYEIAYSDLKKSEELNPIEYKRLSNNFYKEIQDN